jgi:predicted PurR-regulated permease PerM
VLTPRPLEAPEGEERRPTFPQIHLRPDVIIAVGVAVAFCWVAQVVVITLFVSTLIALTLDPVVIGLAKLRIPRSLGAFVAVLLLSLVSYGLIRQAYRGAMGLSERLPELSSRVRAIAWRVQEKAASVRQATETMLPPEDSHAVKVRQESTWTDILSREAASLSGLVLALTFVPFLVYFMLSWQEHVHAALVQLFDEEHRLTAQAAISEIVDLMRTFVLGNVVIGATMSLIGIAVFAVLGIPDFVFVGTLSGFLSVVPYFGVILAILPPVVAGLPQMSVALLIEIVCAVLGLHLLVINVLYPKVIGHRLSLNPLVVTVALLFMGWLWGASGLFLAVPIAGALKIILDSTDSLRPLGTLMGDERAGFLWR